MTRGAKEGWSREERAMVVTLCLCGMTSALFQTVVTPLMAFFVMDSGVCDNLVDPGYYASFVTSAGHIGRGLTSFGWGRYSDRHGRVVVIELALTGIVVASLVQSWTLSFGLAIAARFGCGCLDQTWSMVKLLAAERLPTEKQATAMSSLGAAYGMAMLLGPAIGGVLARPAVEYPLLGIPPDALLARRPYLLPHLTVATVTLVTLGMARLFLPADSRRREPAPSAAEYGSLGASEDAPTGCCSAFCCARKPALATAFYTLVSCAEFTEDVVFPLWAAAPRDVGGLALDSSQIGLLLAIAGAAIVPGQLLLFPTADRELGTLGVMRYGVVATAPLALLMPLAAVSDQPAWTWTCLAITKVFRLFLAEFVFSAQGIASNNAVAVERRGAYLGVQAMICAIGRIFGPLLCAPLFAWSLRAPPPINYSTTFILITAQLVAAGFVAFAMPLSINLPLEDAAKLAPEPPSPLLPPPRSRSSSYTSVTTLKRSRSPQPLFLDETAQPTDPLGHHDGAKDLVGL